MKSTHPDEAAPAAELLITACGSSIELRAVLGRLKAAGASVVDLPDGAGTDGAAQRPSLILCDLASDGAIGRLARYHGSLPPEEAPIVIALGTPRGEPNEAETTLVSKARQRFRRPIDVQSVVDVALAAIRQTRPSRAPQSQGGELLLSPLKPRQSQPARTGAVLSVPAAAPEQLPSNPPPALPSPAEDGPSPLARASGAPAQEHSVVSPELETLLAEAERRVQAQIASHERGVPSAPPGEPMGTLSDDVWDALAEPLDEELDNPLPEAPEDEPAAPPSPLVLEGPAGTAPPAPGDSTVPPGLWRGDDELEPELPPESEQTSGSMGPLTTAGHGAGAITLAPGQVREPAEPAPADADAFEDAPATRAPGPPSTTAAGHRARHADTLPPAPRAASVPPEARTSAHDAPPPSEIDSRAPGSLQQTHSGAVSAGPPSDDAASSSGARALALPGALVRGASALVLGRAVRQRFTGCLTFEVDRGLRRVVFKDGDVVIAASAVHGESLVAFLTQRGDLSAEMAAQIEHRVPIFGRHAGAALIARGLLEQSELWPVLRAHAEWVLSQLFSIERGAVQIEVPVPERLGQEPAVFGGATGAEVLVEVIQRAVPPGQALAYLGSEHAALVPGAGAALLAECALSPSLLELVERARTTELGVLVASATEEPTLPCVLYALCLLEVLEVKEPAAPAARAPRPRSVEAPDRFDDEAVRARVLARRALVDEGDYFAVLGVPRQATGYDIRRSYVELRRQFDPRQVLRPSTLDLEQDVSTILEVLDEAYEILRDQQRRERYRRAIESTPHS